MLTINYSKDYDKTNYKSIFYCFPACISSFCPECGGGVAVMALTNVCIDWGWEPVYWLIKA